MTKTAHKGNTKPIYKGVDYTGKQFYNWTVLGKIHCFKSPSGKTYHTKWLCQCNCGSEPKMVTKENLLKGATKGCLNCTGIRHMRENNNNWKGFGEISGSVFNRIRSGARVRDLDLFVNPELLNKLWDESKGICALSGLALDLQSTASLDRIDSSIGYIQGNIQWVHKDINKMKNDLDEEHFKDLCRLVAQNINQ
jgi:hypothetical protein